MTVYQLDDETWRGLQEASTRAFAQRRSENGRRLVAQDWASVQKLMGALAAAAIVASGAVFVIYRAATAPTIAHADYPPASPIAVGPVAVAPTVDAPALARRPGATITVTYPVGRARGAGATARPALAASAVEHAAATASREAVEAPALGSTGASETAMPDLAALGPRAPAPGPAVIEPMAAPVIPAAAPVARYTADAGIRNLLERYEAAYDRRDVQTAAALWPSLDRRALTRAFASLDSQDVSFDRCDIDASDQRGSAICVGTVRYVPSVGRGVEKEGHITWTFDVARAGEDWRITRLRAR